MKEFIFLFRGGRTSDASDEQLDAHERSWDDWMDDLEVKGVLIDGLPMKNDLVTIDSNGARPGVVDDDTGLSGYLILETSDMDSAVAMAKGCPIFDFGGSIEVRELESHLDDLHDDDDDDGLGDIEA